MKATRGQGVGRCIESLETRRLLATIGNNLSVGDALQNFRIAISATAEYTTMLGGATNAMNSIDTLVANLNSIFEPELAIHLDLVADNDLLVFTDTATDGFDDGNSPSRLIDENQEVIDRVIGDANYDIGHVLGARSGGASGIAGLRVVGWTNWKARGVSTVTGAASNWLSLVAHEIGHQFAGGHSFNGVLGSCGANRGASSAYEPGSGSTLMSYAGNCGGDNLQSRVDQVFNSTSFEEIQSYIRNYSRAAPFSTTSLPNAIPTVNGGSDYVIPANTPFELTATGSDTDAGDQLTYSWEGLDLGPAQSITNWTDNGSSPLFRTFTPRSSPVRVFPQLADLLNNVDTAPKGELLPATNRDMNFRVTVRDGNGGVSSDDVRIEVRNTDAPFVVTSPNTAVSWTGGSTRSVTWNVAGTTSNGIDASSVDILLSVDGGQTFPIVLADATNNDGSATITVPNLDSSNARLKVKGTNNIFFDLSDRDFTINASSSAAGVTLTPGPDWGELIEGGEAKSYRVALNTEPAGSVSIRVSADAETLVSTDGVNFAATQTLTLNSTSPRTVYARAITDGLPEGPWQTQFGHSIIASTSDEYPVGIAIESLAAHVTDLELPPVVGMDFDYKAFGEPPNNWGHEEIDTPSGSSTVSYDNLMRDDGLPTAIDLTFDFSPYISVGTGASSSGANSSSKPSHLPSLAEIDGYNWHRISTVATWSDLVPGRNYGIFVFGLENSGGNEYIQDITISGAEETTFTQVLIDGVLQVNDETGSSSRDLVSYEEVMAADADGRISISIRGTPESDGIAIAGLAIREIPPSGGSQVVGRHLFYNNSLFDGHDPAGNASDDAAIATDKSALLPGETATPENYSNYAHGINGVMIDVRGLTGPVDASDFVFRMGNDDSPSGWTTMTVSPSVAVRTGGGVGGADRISLIWPDGMIVNTWLEVTMRSSSTSGLQADDIFYFGNIVGDAGGTETAARTDFFDLQSAFAEIFSDATITSPHDTNRDGTVNFADLQIMFENVYRSIALIDVSDVSTVAARVAFADDPRRARIDRKEDVESDRQLLPPARTLPPFLGNGQSGK